MQKRSVIGSILCVLFIGLTVYVIFYYKTTHYDIPADYPMVIGTGTTYYIDNVYGDDSQSGLSPSIAWKTVAKVNTFTFNAGDQILFVRNGIWRERIIPQSGDKEGWLYYGAYGTGAKPIFLGSITLDDTSKWEDIGNNTWKWTAPLDEDVGNLIFNNESTVGIKKWSMDNLLDQDDFYFNKASKMLYLKSSSNPASYYSKIECALGQHMLYRPHETYPHIGVHSISNVVFENLAFRYGGAYALKFQNVHHIQVLNCEIAWMGGAEVDGQLFTRYGNGIEFFGQAFYCLSNGNAMYQIYDSGISYQAINTPAAGIGLKFTNNIIATCGLSGYELWLRASKGEITDVSFTNNTLQDIGFGWGSAASQRKAGANWGFAFLLDTTQSPIHNIEITENRVNHTKTAIFVRSGTFNGFDSVIVDNNQYQGGGSDVVYAEFALVNGSPGITTQYTLNQFSVYQTQTGKDTHSTVILN